MFAPVVQWIEHWSPDLQVDFPVCCFGGEEPKIFVQVHLKLSGLRTNSIN